MIKDAWVDLHTHTCCSDGLLTPTEMVAESKALGMAAIGIVDHDTMEGLPEARKAGKKYGVEIVPGVEFSSKHRGIDIHIIGYYLDPHSKRLVDYLERFREERFRRAHRMVHNLNRLGLNISIDEVDQKARGKSLGRPHLAEVLMEKGYVETFQEAFHKYIGYGSAAYEEKYKISPEQAIRLIAEARGLSFLAHPGYAIDDSAILSFIKAGLDGLEVLHPNLTEHRTQHLQKLAKQHQLLMSGGSDCHGGRNGKLCIGSYSVPYAILDEMKRILKKQYDVDANLWNME